MSMRPDERELDDEIRGHMALSILERVERGEDPESARLAALREFGYVPAIRHSMRRIWYGRASDAAAIFGQEIRIALRSLLRAKGLAVAVVVTLALGIGANAAVFSVVRGVLLRPLVNRDEGRIVYIRQNAPGIRIPNLTFSVPEIRDLTAGVQAIGAFGDFSTTDLTMVGAGEPRTVRAGVVNGDYFEVMGLRPVLGRLLTAADDGADAPGAAVLTHRFWTSALKGDPSVIGRSIRLGPRSATIVGILEPSVPYPADTEIIANIVTSPHHLGATMATERRHRMTELFGRLAPGATLEDARAELASRHAAMMRVNTEAYPANAGIRIRVRPLRDQITAPARDVLQMLLAAAALVFVIACSNVANLILARSVRREGELAVRAALGASPGALRRTLLAESLVLCVAGAVVGLLLARPFVSLLARYASRFSLRALEVTVDASLLWVGAGLAMVAAVLLAYVPRLPSAHAPGGLTLAAGSARLTPATNRHLRTLAIVQIAFSFVLLAGAGTTLAALNGMRTAQTGYNMRQVLALDVPPSATGMGGGLVVGFLQEATRRISALPGVEGVAAGSFVPWRDAEAGPNLQFSVAADALPAAEEQPQARLRVVAPGFFPILGIPLLAGRDFTGGDRADSEPVVIVSQSLAQRLFPAGDAVGRALWWTNPVSGSRLPRRIVGVAADVEDESVMPGPALTVYHPLEQLGHAGRLFVHTSGDPYAVVPDVMRVIREISPDQAVERASTLADVRTQVLATDRLSAAVLSGFAGVALLIAAVGLAGVLAFGVSARTREFGVMLAMGSPRRRLLFRVLRDGAVIVAIGIVAGIVGGYAFTTYAAGNHPDMRLPGALPLLGAAFVLGTAAIVASLLPAARASRVDVLQALRSAD